MPEGELEKVMVDFVDGRYDILVCTTIIETGLDIPRANTMIVNRADASGWRSSTSCAGASAARASARSATWSSPRRRA